MGYVALRKIPSLLLQKYVWITENISIISQTYKDFVKILVLKAKVFYKGVSNTHSHNLQYLSSYDYHKWTSRLKISYAKQ